MFVYGHRGAMQNGTDVVLIQEYVDPQDSGQASLFVGGRQVPLPNLRVERAGTNRPATLRNVRELLDDWLLGFATYKPQSTKDEPMNRAWLLIHIQSGQTVDLGEYCGRCSRR